MKKNLCYQVMNENIKNRLKKTSGTSLAVGPMLVSDTKRSNLLSNLIIQTTMKPNTVATRHSIMPCLVEKLGNVLTVHS